MVRFGDREFCPLRFLPALSSYELADGLVSLVRKHTERKRKEPWNVRHRAQRGREGLRTVGIQEACGTAPARWRKWSSIQSRSSFPGILPAIWAFRKRGVLVRQRSGRAPCKGHPGLDPLRLASTLRRTRQFVPGQTDPGREGVRKRGQIAWTIDRLRRRFRQRTTLSGCIVLLQRLNGMEHLMLFSPGPIVSQLGPMEFGPIEYEAKGAARKASLDYLKCFDGDLCLMLAVNRYLSQSPRQAVPVPPGVAGSRACLPLSATVFRVGP